MSDARELAKLKPHQLQALAPLCKNAEAYDAYLLWLAHKEAICYGKLLGRPPYEELLRTAERLQFIEELKNMRQEVLGLEKHALDQRKPQ